MLLLSFILFQNVLLYAQTEITGKIGKIKSNFKSFQNILGKNKEEITMNIYNLNDNQKSRVKMYRIHKNPRYKLIELNQKIPYRFGRELFYLFISYVELDIKKDLIEISSDKLKEIEYDNKTNKEQSQNLRWISGGTGF